MTGAEGWLLRQELERLAARFLIVGDQAQRLLDEGTAWIARETFDAVLDVPRGVGVRAAVQGHLIDPGFVELVPEALRLRVSVGGVDVQLERLDEELRELLDGDLLGEVGGLLLGNFWAALLDAWDRAHRLVEELQRTS